MLPDDRPDALPDEALSAACALVGRFMHDFARMEQALDRAVAKLLSE
ncbi:hypothetical protein [Salinarimonas soli]|nr:hypothetical protein [Salinarimonas soli]